MGLLIPQDFPMSSLRNDAERDVVNALCDGLSDGWYVLPDVGLSGHRDYQMDIVIAHEKDGIAVIEVKGHSGVSIRNGRWVHAGSELNPQPFSQASTNSYALRDRIRAESPEFGRIEIKSAVAFPNAMQVAGNLPPEIDPAQLITSNDLGDVRDAIDRLMSYRPLSPIGTAGLKALVDMLRPDADLEWDPAARMKLAQARLEKICGHQVRALERLDTNRKVMVTGGAGSGKTRLAMAWALRAHMRGERVLLTCYNDPLGGMMRSRLPEDERLMVGPFLEIALSLQGLPVLPIPENADRDFWENDVVGHLVANWHRVTQRFDTIVIDEAQDFSPAWIALLETLLDPKGPRRLLMVGDYAQVVHNRGFAMPSVDDGWTRCELVNNCRNTFSIASILRKQLGGAPAPTGGPESIGVSFAEANDVDSVAELVGEEIDRLVDFEGHDPERILVATFSTQVRDRLREEFAFVPWEQGQPTTIICENVHRVKGLEFDYVVLVATADDAVSRVTDALLYVGVSRAIFGLTVIGPRSIADRLGIE